MFLIYYLSNLNIVKSRSDIRLFVILETFGAQNVKIFGNDFVKAKQLHIHCNARDVRKWHACGLKDLCSLYDI